MSKRLSCIHWCNDSVSVATNRVGLSRSNILWRVGMMIDEERIFTQLPEQRLESRSLINPLIFDLFRTKEKERSVRSWTCLPYLCARTNISSSVEMVGHSSKDIQNIIKYILPLSTSARATTLGIFPKTGCSMVSHPQLGVNEWLILCARVAR